jgi:hypothetical protein
MATHGITSSTYDKRIIVDAGAVYKNYGQAGEALLGATRGGNTFVIETDYRDMPVDGAHGMVKGGRRITNVVARITANFIEVVSANIGIALPASASASFGGGTHTSWTRALQIATADYLTNIAIVGEVNGATNAFVGILSNPIADGNFELSFADKDESVLAVTFTAHFDPAALATEPWEIRWPAS